jgi:hypothetical protein
VPDKLSAGANKAANTHRWHEGIAIGALPQNVFHTAQQLDEMARIVLDYAVAVEGNNNTQQKTTLCRPTIVAAYATAELHGGYSQGSACDCRSPATHWPATKGH